MLLFTSIIVHSIQGQVEIIPVPIECMYQRDQIAVYYPTSDDLVVDTD